MPLNEMNGSTQRSFVYFVFKKLVLVSFHIADRDCRQVPRRLQFQLLLIIQNL